jgi:hypothetical protein
MEARQDGGEETRLPALAKAQRVAEVEPTSLGWSVQALQGRRQSNPQKVRIAAR